LIVVPEFPFPEQEGLGDSPGHEEGDGVCPGHTEALADALKEALLLKEELAEELALKEALLLNDALLLNEAAASPLPGDWIGPELGVIDGTTD